MAIAHCSVKNGAKGKGAAHGNYISGQGKYEAKSDVKFFADYNMPNGFENGNAFWKAADKSERKNGRVYKEIEAALPREIKSLKEQKRLIGQFIQDAGLKNQPMTVAIHQGKSGDNPHMHLMFCERTNDGIERENPEQFFKRPNAKNPERGGCGKNRDFNKKEFVQDVRATWEQTVNNRLEILGHEERIDMRSLKAQGIDRLPQPKLGYAVTGIESAGGYSTRRERWYEVMNHNASSELESVADHNVAVEYESSCESDLSMH